MRILYDHQMFAIQKFGGISRIFIELMKRLSLDPDCKINWYRGFHIDEYETDGFRNKLNSYWSFNSQSSFVSKHSYKLNRLGLKLFSKFHPTPDVYHPTYYDHETVSNVKSKKLVITVCDMIPEIYFRELERFQPLLKSKAELIRKADLIFVISKSTREDLLRYVSVNPAKIICTYLASNLDQVTPSPIPSECTKKPYFLYVGTRSKYKNFKVLMDAIALEPRLKNNFNVICFGGTGDFVKPEIESMTRDNMKDNFIYMNGTDDLLKTLYMNAAALAYTSNYEGFGLPPLEAMESGCPVICCRHSSLPEVVGENAIFFEHSSPEQLAYALLKSVEDNSLRETLIKNGRLRAQCFSWDKTAQETLHGYRKILG